MSHLVFKKALPSDMHINKQSLNHKYLQKVIVDSQASPIKSSIAQGLPSHAVSADDEYDLIIESGSEQPSTDLVEESKHSTVSKGSPNSHDDQHSDAKTQGSKWVSIE